MSTEAFDKDDEFHKKLAEICEQKGKGPIISVVWSTLKYPGKTKGMAICQEPASMVALRFTAEHDDVSYMLKFGGTLTRVVSDYFEAVPNEDQLKTLKAFADKYGESWKESLNDAWTSGWDVREPKGYYLRQLRNDFGPEWLIKWRFK